MDLDKNTFRIFLNDIQINNKTYKYFNVPCINEEKYSYLPFSIRVLLESAVRNCDEQKITSKDIKNILNWPDTHMNKVEIQFLPSRVILQDFTGIPAIVDFAAMRDAVYKIGGDPTKVNPICPVDLVMDHTIQVDLAKRIMIPVPSSDSPGPIFSRNSTNKPTKSPQKITSENQILIESACKTCPFHNIRTECAGVLEKNQSLEFERNYERFQLLKWGAQTFKNMMIVPPGSGIVHQVNLECVSRVVFNKDQLLYPDSLVGTDSHTTMINSLGIVGWGVGGIEAECVMLGQAINMVLPEVVGYKIIGKLNEMCTSTDVVLTITKHLRTLGVMNKFVEFYGPSIEQLSLADRATIANMCPEYGATIAYFAADEKSMQYLLKTGRSQQEVTLIREYLKQVKLFRDDTCKSEPKFSQIVELDLSTIVSCVSGPKRPQDKTLIFDLAHEFKKSLNNKNNFIGFALSNESLNKQIKLVYKSNEYSLSHGSIVIASINSCTNTSNPSVMLSAGMLAKKAIEHGLKVKPYIKTSLSPGSGVVTEYLTKSNMLLYLETLGFNIVGYGCMTCINNIDSLEDEITNVIDKNDLVAVGVMSGNRNFEGRINSSIKANYLASPPLVIAYAIAGRVDIDFEKESIGYSDKLGKNVYLKDIWPTRKELQELEISTIIPEIFNDSLMRSDCKQWDSLKVTDSDLYEWNFKSTYIKRPPYFDNNFTEIIENAHVLLYLGDSITTDHISPAGSIVRNSPAAKYLIEKGVAPRDFNSYGSRRGNDAIMSRGTFANSRLVNKLIRSQLGGGKTLYVPNNQIVDIFDASDLYKKNNIPIIIIAGKDYGCGSPREWASKGPLVLGVKAVIAESFDRTHRNNLISMGIIPFQFIDDESAHTLKLTGKESFNINKDNQLDIKSLVHVETNTGIKFKVLARIETSMELVHLTHGGTLNYMIHNSSLG